MTPNASINSHQSHSLILDSSGKGEDDVKPTTEYTFGIQTIRTVGIEMLFVGNT
jgi:hypothetical protein